MQECPKLQHSNIQIACKAFSSIARELLESAAHQPVVFANRSRRWTLGAERRLVQSKQLFPGPGPRDFFVFWMFVFVYVVSVLFVVYVFVYFVFLFCFLFYFVFHFGFKFIVFTPSRRVIEHRLPNL